MLNQDYKEMLSILLENEVDFLLVGAYAMAAHGYPRATADIDIFVRADSTNLPKLYKAITEFGAPVNDISVNDFERPGMVFQIGVAPRRIDILNMIDGVTFEEAEKDKDIIEIEGLKVPIISKQKLITNKLSTGREKDSLDAKKLGEK
jgi:Nucleotidyl transferase of unknown function (DUF2204)